MKTPSPWLTALLIFILALLVRLPGLDVFFTADEFLWVDRSRNFLGGLLDPNFECLLPFETATNAVPGQGLECTLRTGHPGVVTMWSGAAGLVLQWLTTPEATRGTLLSFVETLPVNPVSRNTIAPIRLPTVLLTALFVAVVYLLLRKLFNPPVPLLAGLLLALNPFHIALSRVLHHDALSTIFLTTAGLSVIIYYAADRRRRWIALAGALAGIAMLSKSTGFFLIAYTGLLALWDLAARRQRGAVLLTAFGQTLLDGVIWGGMVLLSFTALWPAMWVIPWQVLNVIYSIGFKYASDGHAKGVYFLGNVTADPGPWFYPVTWLFRTNFWALAGGLLAVVALVLALRNWRRQDLSPSGPNHRRGLLLWFGAFVLFFLLAMTLNSKKQDRYLLPIYPWLDIIAAVGLWVWFGRWKARWLLGGVLVVNLGLIAWFAPYYFAYYNPLFGGGRVAAQVMTVGWGDGLNLAADYLNTLPDADKAASWYGSTFAPYFNGETIRYSDQKGNALAGDYTVFYINQMQREYPDREIWRYLEENHSLVQTIPLHGVDYAWVFTAPGLPHYVEDQFYSGIAGLLGWRWQDNPNPDNTPVIAGETLHYNLFWEYLGKTPAEDFFFRLLDADGTIWTEGRSRPTAQFADANAWRPGQIIKEAGTLSIPGDTPPGDYQLQIGFYTSAPAVISGELTFPTPQEPLDAPLQVIRVESPNPVATLPPQLQMVLRNQVYLAKAGTIIDQSEEALSVTLRWIATSPLDADYQLAFALVDAGGDKRYNWVVGPPIGFHPMSAWQPNTILRSQHHLPLDDPRLPGGNFQLFGCLIDAESNEYCQPLTAIDLPGRVRNFDVPALNNVSSVEFAAPSDGRLELLGLANISDLAPNQPFNGNLYWRTSDPIAADYTIFVQLIGPDGTVIAQQDSQPQQGQAPTSTWATDEIVVHTFNLALPATLPAGNYQLIAGLYLLETGERLQTTNKFADFVTVWEAKR